MQADNNSLTGWASNADRDAFRDGMEVHLRSIAPDDLAGLPLAIVFESETVGIAGRLGGLAAPSLVNLLPDKWRGLGPAFLLADDGVRVNAGDQWREQLMAIAVHEICHYLDSDLLATIRRLAPNIDKPTEQDAARARARVDGNAAEFVAGKNTNLMKWDELAGHDWRYIRAAIHAWNRSKLREYSPSVIHDARQYGISTTGNYRAALGGELDPFDTRSFAEIREAPPPLAFKQLWNRDLQAFAAKHPLDDAVAETARLAEMRIA